MFINKDSWNRLKPEEVVHVLRLSAALKASWEKETCYPGDAEKWTKNNPSVGQCAVTSLVVQNHLGGGIHRNDHFHHYWNQLPSGGFVDFTHEQFGIDHYIESQGQVKEDSLLKGKSAEKAMTKQRYMVLRRKVLNRLKSLRPTVVLLSSNAQPEYIHDIIEVMGTPQGTVHHFRYRLRYVDDAIRKLIPVEGNNEHDHLAGMEAMIVYLNQERRLPGVYVWNATIPVRVAILRRSYKTGEGDESVAHFFFEVRESVLKTDGFDEGLRSIFGKYFERAYAFLTYEDMTDLIKRHRSSEVFETQCKCIKDVGFSYKSENKTVNYESPLFILFEGIFKKRCLKEKDALMKPKYDSLVPKSYYALWEGITYRFRFRTFSLDYSKPYEVRLRMKERLFNTPEERALVVKSAYDSECWELSPSFIEQGSLGHMTLDIRSLAAHGNAPAGENEERPQSVELDWIICTIFQVRRRLSVRVLDTLGDLLFAGGPAYIAVTKLFETIPEKPILIEAWPYVLLGIYFLWSLVKLARRWVWG